MDTQTTSATFTAVIYGMPYASANTHEITSRGGRSWLRHSEEYREWWKSALDQLDSRLRDGYKHIPIRATVTSKSGKNRNGESSYVTNPLFDFGEYRVRIWFCRPNKIPQYKWVPGAPILKKDGTPSRRISKKQREIRYTKTGAMVMKEYRADTSGVLKGVEDALQEAGVYENDDQVVISGPVYRVTNLPDGAVPFLIVEVTDAREALFDDGPIPTPPIYPEHVELYMPSVQGIGEWYKEREQERSYQKYIEEKTGKPAPVPVSKLRCKRCQLLIGYGHACQEIWAHFANEDWGEPRWKGKVVPICERCAKERFKTDAAVARDRELRKKVLLAQYKEADGDLPARVATLAEEVIESFLWKQYIKSYRLVADTEIEEASWKDIDDALRNKGKELGYDISSTSNNSRVNDGRLPARVIAGEKAGIFEADRRTAPEIQERERHFEGALTTLQSRGSGSGRAGLYFSKRS